MENKLSSEVIEAYLNKFRKCQTAAVDHKVVLM